MGLRQKTIENEYHLKFNLTGLTSGFRLESVLVVACI